MMTMMVTLTLITMKILEMNSINPNFIVFSNYGWDIS